MAYNGNGSMYGPISGSGSGQNGAPIPPNSLAPRVENRVKPEEWWYTENGRSYDTFRRGKYMFPMDEGEMDRMDIFHKFFLVARREDNASYGGLCQRPLPHQPRILDLGCGTGIWVIDMADRHQGRANILGWDLSLIQPLRIPPGVEFQRCDIEEPWSGVEESSFDLIHMKMLAGSIENWVSLYSQALRYLKPETGVLEHVEIDFTPKCEDGELPEDSHLKIWAHELTVAMERAGRPITVNPHTVGLLERLGYVDVKQVSKRVPFNSWPPDEHEREMGKWFNLGITQGLHALSIAPLTRMNGYDPEQVSNLVGKVRKEMCSRGMRSYCTIAGTFGQHEGHLSPANEREQFFGSLQRNHWTGIYLHATRTKLPLYDLRGYSPPWTSMALAEKTYHFLYAGSPAFFKWIKKLLTSSL